MGGSGLDRDEIQPLFAAVTDCNIYGVAQVVGCQHASMLIGYRRASDGQVLVDLIEGNMTWRGRGDQRQHAHPSDPDAADGPRGSYFVDTRALQPFVTDITEDWLARERRCSCHQAAVPSWWAEGSGGEKRATWTRWNSISTGQVPLSSATGSDREKHRYICSFDETVLWFEDLRQLGHEEVKSAVTAAIIEYEETKGFYLAPSCLKGKLAGLLPLDEWAGLRTHGVRVTSDFVQTNDPHLNCYGFASGLMNRLRAAKAKLPGIDGELRSYLQEPIWRLNGYRNLEEVKWTEALFHGCCCEKCISMSAEVDLALAPEWPGQTWADHSMVKKFLQTDPQEFRYEALDAWRSRNSKNWVAVMAKRAEELSA